MKRFFAISVFALTLAAGGAGAAEVFVRFGPPRPPREVVVVRPGPRHVWIPGYYRWTGHRYAWVAGSWVVPPRPRAVWAPGYWKARRGGFVWVGGYWR